MSEFVHLEIIPAASIEVQASPAGTVTSTASSAPRPAQAQQAKVHGNIALMSLDHAETKNAMGESMAHAFAKAVAEISENDSIRCAVLTGKNGVFSSGGDFAMLRSMIDQDPQESVQFMLRFYEKFLCLLSLPFPIIAAVNGHAIGAAFAISLACDLRYYTENSKYAANFVKLGLHPGMGSTFLLREICGRSLAQELLLTGRFVSGEEAAQKGICHRALPKEQVLPAALASAREIALNSPEATRLVKRGFYDDEELKKTLAYEANCQSQSFLSKDYKEAMEAITEGRRYPEFKEN